MFIYDPDESRTGRGGGGEEVSEERARVVFGYAEGLEGEREVGEGTDLDRLGLGSCGGTWVSLEVGDEGGGAGERCGEEGERGGALRCIG